MKPSSVNICCAGAPGGAQRGLALFIALIALVILSLAAVALVRSVDTTTIVAGNLAFKQSSVRSGDAGVEAAMAYLSTVQAANTAVNVLNVAAHPFNQDLPVAGYYSSVHDNAADPAFLNLFDAANWTNANSVLVGTDGAGYTTRYIIQRMCRVANQPVQSADCLFSGALIDNNGQQVRLPQQICDGAGCPVAGQTPMIRVTARIDGPRNTVSYVQGFVY